MLDDTTLAKIVFAETASLRPQPTQVANPDNPNYWDSQSLAILQQSRAQIAAIAQARNGQGVAPPVTTIPADSLSQRVWTDCQAAVVTSKTIVVNNCDHFVIWPSADAGQTPVTNPQIPAHWPYDQEDKITTTYGPLINTVAPQSALIYIFVYCGVP